LKRSIEEQSLRDNWDIEEYFAKKAEREKSQI